MTTLSLFRRMLVSRPDVADNPTVFPYLPGQLFVQLKTPVWSTKIQTAISGVERRRAMWSYPIWKFQVAYEFLRENASNPELHKLWIFFNSQEGSFLPWNYFDPWDHKVVSQFFGVGDGITKTFQLKRSLTSGGLSWSEPVKALVSTPSIYVAGTSVTAFTINSGGSITFVTAPAAGAALTWTGQFYFVCRFAIDELNTQQMLEGFWSGDSINFQTFKD